MARKNGGGPCLPRGCLLVASIAALLGCAGGPNPWPPPPSGLAWPMPPETPRVRHVGAFSTPADLGIGTGWWARLWRWLSAGEEVRLVHPAGVKVGADGEIWVVDTAARVVHAFSPERRSYRRITGTPEEPLLGPIDIALGPEGRIYVTDSLRGRVLSYDGGLGFGGALGANVLQRPTGIACDPGTGTVYVVDTLQGRIAAFEAGGRFKGWIARPGGGPGELHFPTYITIGAGGVLYVTDSLNFRVQALGSDGEPRAALGALGDGPGAFSKPKGVAVDADGHVYVVDSLFDNVQVFDPGGQLLLALGQTGSGPAQMYLPQGIAIDARGLIYVADVYNGRIQVFQYLPEVVAP